VKPAFNAEALLANFRVGRGIVKLRVKQAVFAESSRRLQLHSSEMKAGRRCPFKRAIYCLTNAEYSPMAQCVVSAPYLARPQWGIIPQASGTVNLAGRPPEKSD